MSLKTKLTLFCLLIGLAPAAVMGVYSVRLASDHLRQQAVRQLQSARDDKQHALAALLDRWAAETRIYAGVKDVYNSLGMLRDYAMDFRKDPRMKLGKDYDELHAYLGFAYRPFVEKLGFEDALLVGDDGRILFTWTQGRDLGENLAKGDLLRDTPLAQAFAKAMKGETVLADLAPYPALEGRPAAFLATPVLDHNGKVEGVAALRLPLAAISGLMGLRSGMGVSGETYLVGPDRLMRSDSHRDPAHRTVAASFAAPGAGAVDTEAVRRALAGETGALILPGYHGEEVVSAFAPVAAAGAHWALVAEISSGEAFGPVRSLRLAALLVGLATLLAVAAATRCFLQRALVRPVEAIGAFLAQVEAGDLRAELAGSFKAEMKALADGVRSMTAQIKTRLGFAQGVLEGVTFPCLVLDTAGRITYANSHLLDLMDRAGRPEDILGTTPGEFFHGRAEARTISREALDGQRRMSAEAEFTTAKGRSIQVAVNATPIYDLDGALIGVFTLYYDLTAIRAQERRIREQHEQMARVAEEATGISIQVAQAASELSAQVQGAARGAALQSERSTETATSMHQMNATTLEVAQGAAQAAQRTGAARQKAVDGREVVEQAVRSITRVHEQAQAMDAIMSDLGERAGRIGSIVTTINDIADQTNLLALNAAIEAARAGDAGRGFAVVADEVRKLAEKTMQATREVSESVRGIREGTEKSLAAARAAGASVAESERLAAASGQVLHEIVDLMEGAAGQVSAIATAGEEQSAASAEVARAMEDVSQVSRQTAAGMEQSMQAIAELEDQAHQLKALMADMGADQDGANVS
jgi:methyl-accepting chemotaxis protein